MKIIQKPSPNFDERTVEPEMIIIHATATNTLEETFGYLIHSQEPRRVSSHYVVDRDGTVYQLVDETKRAWHAGVSTWNGHTDINNRSIGIEFQCPALSDTELGEFTPEQITAGLELCRAIANRWHIIPHNVTGHSDIAPERKHDPGLNFPWEIFVAAGFGDNPTRR